MRTKDSQKAPFQKQTETLIQRTNEFCDQHLNQEYKVLCEKAIRKMVSKRVERFLTGPVEVRAAAIVYAIGSMNLLFKKRSHLRMSADEICEGFGTAKSATAQKAKIVRDTLGFHTEFLTEEMKEHSPFAVYPNGRPVYFGVPSSEWPEAAQERSKRNR